MGQIKRVNYVSLPVGDVGRARAFYEETLGLRVTLSQRSWVELDASNVARALYPREADEGRTAARSRSRSKGWTRCLLR
ncbi:VOC family protein [bacterium]|nr:VOC family protein [bacterium]